MGISFYIDEEYAEFGFSYSGFGFFRRMIAKSAGFDLCFFDGFGGKADLDNMQDDLRFLLNASDCEGDINWNNCQTLSKRLFQLKDEVDFSDIGDKSLEEWYKSQFFNLCKALDTCVKRKVFLRWS
jgi:hypothetical protein